jgi:hypothetical protein
MCVTGAKLWNTSSLGVLPCGHLEPVSQCTLGVRAVDRRVTAVDHGEAENLAAQLCLSVFSRICFISSYMRKITMNASSTTR